MWMGLCVWRQGENTWKEGEIWANWKLRTKDLVLSNSSCYYCLLSWVLYKQKVAGFKEQISPLVFSVPLMFSKEFPLLPSLENLRSPNLTQAGMVHISNIQFRTEKRKKIYMCTLFISTGILPATRFAMECLQVTSIERSIVGSDDCLYLNIWVPHDQHGSI